ncbi:MAG: sugar phosphate isomerase/epimerase [Terriglobia bacterium]
MQIGIFAKTFPRPALEETLDAVKATGVGCVQFNLSCAGQPPMPDQIATELAIHILQAHQTRDLTMAAVSGTYNMIHPNPAHRAQGMRRLAVLAEASHKMGTQVITLCTGTRDQENMWRRHPDNDSSQAWDDLLYSMQEALGIADRHQVTLAIEPEIANVIDTAAKARRLLDQFKSPRLKVVMDGANLFHQGELSQMDRILHEAFELLGSDLTLAHAKDLDRDGEAGNKAAGTGVLNYDLYLSLLKQVPFSGPLILHGLEESEVPFCVRFLREKLERLN